MVRWREGGMWRERERERYFSVKSGEVILNLGFGTRATILVM
jgi:hypothetical protein